MVGVGVFVFDPRGRILLGKRLSRYGRGFYSLPGGKVDWNETVRDAAVREPREETNLTVTNLEQVGYCDEIHPEQDMHFVTLYWMGDVENVSVLENTEPTKCEGWIWVYPDHCDSLSPVCPPLSSFLVSPQSYLIRKKSYDKQLQNSSL